MSCAKPLDAALLADYWTAAALALTPAEEQAMEEHLLACDACSARLEEVIALAGGVRRLAREGSLRLVVSDAFLKRAAEDGLHVREYTPPEGGSVQCTVTAEDNLLIGRLPADLRGARQLDLCLCNAQGAELIRLADIPFNPAAESVSFQQPIAYAKAAPTETMIARLVAVDESGAERLVGEYTFHHTRTLPGPGAW